ncbi:MAG TPA: DmsE family decaheme c-type cytochrome [Candidatus Angelobacter sp.]|jgi:DmsE family decaheme c-type cytochrome|nr:DmsE family decaheme c-type cytochrome [Candidatus Angelobacter sp.]
MFQRKLPLVACAALVFFLACTSSAWAVQEQSSNAQPSDKSKKKSKNKSSEAADPTSETLARSADQADASQYVGSDTCRTCHEDIAKTFDQGPHWKTVNDKHGPRWQGCEACHGPGKAHAESTDPTKIIRFAGLSRETASQRCMACHQFGQEHANFMRSEHLKNNVGCTDCHSVHHPQEVRQLLTKAQPQLCYSCHLEVKPEFSRPFHHKVNEGLLVCSNCHNPHGGFLTHQLRATAAQDQLCFNCHTDKAGPFGFEHAPVKTEGCVACHMPHGSANPRLLRRANINLLCLECHTLTIDQAAPGIPSFHNQAQKYQACTMCHVAIHGSNTDHFFFKP